MGEKRAASDSDKEEETEEKSVEAKETKEEDKIIDMEVFQQILDLDEEDDDEFSRGMVFAFFSQAEEKFVEMKDALDKKDLANLASLGHFLKGSSAALGLWQVQSSCEKIQNYGGLKDVKKDETLTLSEEDALGRIADLLKITRTQYDAAKLWLQNRYKTGDDET